MEPLAEVLHSALQHMLKRRPLTALQWELAEAPAAGLGGLAGPALLTEVAVARLGASSLVTGSRLRRMPSPHSH